MLTIGIKQYLLSKEFFQGLEKLAFHILESFKRFLLLSYLYLGNPTLVEHTTCVVQLSFQPTVYYDQYLLHTYALSEGYSFYKHANKLNILTRSHRKRQVKFPHHSVGRAHSRLSVIFITYYNTQFTLCIIQGRLKTQISG